MRYLLLILLLISTDRLLAQIVENQPTTENKVENIRENYIKWFNQSSQVELPTVVINALDSFYKANNVNLALQVKFGKELKMCFNSQLGIDIRIIIIEKLIAKYSREANNYPIFILDKELDKLRSDK